MTMFEEWQEQTSPPHAGAWIETHINNWAKTSGSRPLTRGRGLKLVTSLIMWQPRPSPPHAGAWIETDYIRCRDAWKCVAPSRGGVD